MVLPYPMLLGFLFFKVLFISAIWLGFNNFLAFLFEVSKAFIPIIDLM